MPPETKHWEYRVSGPTKLWTFIGLPIALVRDTPRADVVFSPTHYIPRFISIPRVMSIMDLSYLYFPELFRPRDLHQLTSWTKYSVSRAKVVLTISQYSKNDIIKRYGKSELSVSVTYPGLTMQPTPSVLHTSVDIYKKYSISKQFILAVGTIQPRKNYERLIEAFSLFLAKDKKTFAETELVIIGKKGWLYESILQAPKKIGIESKVKFLDFVPDDELSLFYKQAICFALPSLYEGFGLPVIEAMANSCPVVVSTVSSLPEIAGDAGVYVNPENIESIAEGLCTAVKERDQKSGKSRIQNGNVQLSKFSWEKAAMQTLRILEDVGKRG
jgi:glycosyltransferase involved in cell wall biosynthesis